MTKPITIGYYDDGEHRAGTGRYLSEIIGGLDRTRYRPVFFAPRPRHWHDDLRELDAQIVYPADVDPAPEPLLKLVDFAAEADNAEKNAPEKPKRKPIVLPSALAFGIGTAREVRRLRDLFEREPVELLHSNNTGAEPAPIAARLAKIPNVLGTLHVLPSYDLDGVRNGKRYHVLESLSMRSLHHAIACCDAARVDWQARVGFKSEMCSVIYNGIDVKRVERQGTQQAARDSMGLPAGGLLIASVGMLHRYKGFAFLIQALPALLQKFPDAQVAIAGTGPQEMELRRMAARAGVSASIHWLGFCGNVRTLLEAADVYVQPSLVEACPMALLEAGAMGLPVVASAVGGVPEVILDGETGLLVPRMEPAPLASALQTLLSNAEMRAELGAAGRVRVYQNFTRERMVAETLAVYERMLNPWQSARTPEGTPNVRHSDAAEPDKSKSRVSA